MNKCRSCLADIIWAKTEAGTLIPLDATPGKPGANMALIEGVAKVINKNDLFEPVYSGPLYLSHWASCPHAAQHRRSAKK
ncbi:MAG: hypothetical protein AB7V46_12440 [Thermomicrobiales bacterium]